MRQEHVNLSQKENIASNRDKSKYIVFIRNVEENIDNKRLNP